MARTALILVGHGSHISPETADVVWQQVDQLRPLNIADEITAAFWKEHPSFHQVIDTLDADDVTVVPLFTAQGYFTQTIIPAEMGLSGTITQHDGRLIRYTPTLSEHPYLTRVVRERINNAIHESGADPADVSVAIIGHGTKRNPESRRATLAQAEGARHLAAESFAVFLDDTPSIPDIYSLSTKRVIVAVPFFLALGSHTTIDVPAALGLPDAAMTTVIHGRKVIYTLPVGVGDDLYRAILEIVRDAGAPLRDPAHVSAWDCFPSAGRDALIEAVRAKGWIEFGDLTLSLHEVRPTEIDFEREIIEINTLAALRDHVRRDPFRPLATSTDLPRDWVVRIEKRAQLHAVVETIYPALVAEWACRDSLMITALDDLAARQTGSYRRAADLTPQQREQTVAQVCGRCVRQPTWFNGERQPIPCPEACNYWLSRALENT